MKKKAAQSYNIPVIIEEDTKGYFFAFSPFLQGCYAQGKTFAEAMKNIKDVIALHIEDRHNTKESVSLSNSVTMSTITVAA